MLQFGRDIGIDLGTTNVLVYVQGEGVVINEPSMVVLEKDSNEVVAIGREAREMLGRTPSNVSVHRPLQKGVIADYDVTEYMLRTFIARVCGRRSLFKPRIMVCVPSGVTSVEKRAVLEATNQAGASQTFLIEEPMAAALGAGLDVSEPSANMVVDIGGGTTDIAVISLGGIVVSDSIRLGGNTLDEVIQRYVLNEYNLRIGSSSAERIKCSLGVRLESDGIERVEVRGRDTVQGLPKTLEIDSTETSRALREHIKDLIGAVRSVLAETPPELSADIADKGLLLTGGGALLDGFARRLADDIDIPVTVAEDPLTCVARGTGIALQSLDVLADGLLSRKSKTE